MIGTEKFERLKIKSYDDAGSKLEELEVAINPESYSSAYSKDVSSQSGDSGDSTVKMADGKLVDLKVIQFKESIKFDLWLDSTGAIPNSRDVAADVKKLRKILVQYKGPLHSTSFVKLSWGSLKFFGQVESFSIDFLMFSNTGEPLRAKASISLSEFSDADKKNRLNDDQSSDLTHVRMVKAGDNLPLMCYRIYRDASLYSKVAAFNGLSNFMELKPGQSIIFPPLEK